DGLPTPSLQHQIDIDDPRPFIWITLSDFFVDSLSCIGNQYIGNAITGQNKIVKGVDIKGLGDVTLKIMCRVRVLTWINVRIDVYIILSCSFLNDVVSNSVTSPGVYGNFLLVHVNCVCL